MDPGKYAPAQSDSEADCQCSAGSTLIASACEPCPAGTFKDAIGDESCAACALGSFQTSAGRSSCDPCPAGTYRDDLSAPDQ
eukprot:961747-Rhodomonas_salina.1